MAKKSVASKGKFTSAGLDKILDNFAAQPQQMSKESMEAIEQNFTGHDRGFIRRVALATLVQSGQELIDIARKADGELAVELVRMEQRVGEYGKSLKEFAGIMESASIRMGIAMCHRDTGDYQSIVQKAAELQATEVQHV